MTTPAERFLVVRLTSLGDLMHTVPAVAALRAAHPAAQIDWVVERKWAPVLEGSPAINEVIPLDRWGWRVVKTVRRLRQGRYTCVIDFQGLYKSSIIAALTGAPARIGFDSSWAREPAAAMLYTERVAPAGRHVAELNYSLAERAGATRPAIPSYPLRIPAGGGASIRARLADQGIDKYVVIAPGASWRAKSWPAERYGELCRELKNRHAPPAIIICGPGETKLAQAVLTAAAPAKPMVMLTTLEELMGLLAGAQCLIGADSGPLHLATALGTPVVGLYGPTDPWRNGPFGPNVVIETQARAEDISYKRIHRRAPAMLRISVEDVLAHCDRCIGITA